jgi:hypothetical protein
MNIRNVTAFVIAIGITLPAYADVTITDAWVKATAPGQTTAAAYLKIKSDAPAKLIGISSPVAKAVQIHEIKVQDNVMHMRPIDSLDLPAGKTVELKPGAYHIMLENIAEPLKQGATVPLILTIEGTDMQRQSIEVKAEVRSAMPMEKHDDMKDMGNMGGMKGM